MKLRREQPNGANAPLVDIDVASYRVAQGSAAGLINRPTRIAPLHNSDHAYQAQLADHIDRLGKLQQRFYAADRYALLVIIQGMDAAGKDGTIAHVMSGINPQGCDVFSFKQPSQEELQHDFLWRSNRNLPERGKIGIFNRSYYEEVVILRVHPAMLDAEGLAGALGLEHEFWVQRYRSINALQQYLTENNTRIVKIFLHLSKQEQVKRFLDRIDDPDKNWKLSAADVEERKFWDDYAVVYEECLTATSTQAAPWFVVPADEKPISRLIVSQILLAEFEALKLPYPETTPARLAQLATIKAELVAEQGKQGDNVLT
jgi:PPK2 family polyphosphate:nucleotide phosphotransferase